MKRDNIICSLYNEASTEEERVETIKELAEGYNMTQMEVRQILQEHKVYKAKEGKTPKQQYAAALEAVTLIPAKEWMKLTFKSQQALMDIFRGKHAN